MLFGKETRSLYRIDHTDILTSFQDIRDDWEKLRPALYAVDLVDALLADADSQPRVFAVLEQLLTCVSTGENARLELWLRLFEVRLLTLVGYQPLLERCRELHEAERRVDQIIAQAKENISRARRTAVILGFMVGAATLLGAASAWYVSIAAGRPRDGRETLHSLWDWGRPTSM
jgi:recombinational DNA repair protein (RecF pathway)